MATMAAIAIPILASVAGAAVTSMMSGGGDEGGGGGGPYYAPPPPAWTPPPTQTTEEMSREAQQAPLVVPGANVSPLLANVLPTVMESPAEGMTLDEDMRRRAASSAGGMGV